MKFSKSLSKSEVKYKYFGLPKKIREEFPEKDKKFTVIFKKKSYQMSVNNKNCIMITQLYSQHEFKEDEILHITDSKNGFEFTIE